jgi:tetratricopeptide (TPR) repeat protein
MSNDGPERRRPGSGSQESRFAALYRQGTEHLLAGDAERAIEPLLRARALDSDHLQAALNLSGAYILTKRFKKAVGILEALAKRESDNPAVWQNLGAAYLGNPILADDASQRKAIGAFEKALTLDPELPNVAYNIGLIFRDRHEYFRAAEWFEQALQTNPEDEHARRLLAQVRSAAASGSQGGDGKEEILEEE